MSIGAIGGVTVSNILLRGEVGLAGNPDGRTPLSLRETSKNSAIFKEQDAIRWIEASQTLLLLLGEGLSARP